MSPYVMKDGASPPLSPTACSILLMPAYAFEYPVSHYISCIYQLCNLLFCEKRAQQ